MDALDTVFLAILAMARRPKVTKMTKVPQSGPGTTVRATEKRSIHWPGIPGAKWWDPNSKSEP